MARITENSIEKVRLSSDIIQTISDYIELTKRGHNFFGLCPFHNEKTPSFSANEDKQIYKCFGCGAGGGVFNFIMDIEKVDFPEAIEILADRNGIEIEYDKGSFGKQNNIKNEIIEIHKIANNIFTKNILSDSKVMQYLLGRGLRKEIINEFCIGSSVNSYDYLLKILQKEKFSSNAMKNSGLFVPTQKGYIDRFRNRLMFPIHNHTSKIIAFAGRALDPNDKAKYMNSPETPIYNKSKIFYGLWKTKEQIVKNKNAIIVEGYMDFLKMYQSGFKNIIAISGTSFTENHAIQIKRLTNKVSLLYDGDSAGRKAAIRAGYLCLKHSIEPNIVDIPGGLDPDDWIESTKIDEIQNKIENAINLIDFDYKYELGNDQSDSSKTIFINNCIQGLKNINDPVYKELQVNRLARITNISLESIKQNLTQINKKNRIINSSSIEKVEQKNHNQLVEDDLIKLCFSNNHEIKKFIFKNFTDEWLNNDSNKNIFNEVQSHLSSQYDIDESLIISRLSNKLDIAHLSTLLFDIDKNELSLKMAKECVNRLKNSYINKKIELSRESLKNLDTNSEKFNEIIMTISKLENDKNEIL